jgi:predicted MFS family arabinose efflux permease
MGRGLSLAVGYALGGAGAALVVAAAGASSLAALLVGSVMLGGANASIFLNRYAAAEVAPEQSRRRALGLVLFSTTIGAVTGPLLLGPSGGLAHVLGLPRLTGLYLIAFVAFSGSGLALATSFRSTASLGSLAALFRRETNRGPTLRELTKGMRSGTAPVGVGSLVIANFMMVALMGVAPVHLMTHGEELPTIGTAISLHVAGMFTPSALSGWLAVRLEAIRVIAIGCVVLLTSGLLGATVDTSHLPSMMVVLVILGIGWNFGVVGGSTLIASAVSADLRVHVEGIGEVVMALAAAAGAPIAGLMVTLGGFSTLSLSSALLVTCGFVASLHFLTRRQHADTADEVLPVEARRLT